MDDEMEFMKLIIGLAIGLVKNVVIIISLIEVNVRIVVKNPKTVEWQKAIGYVPNVNFIIFNLEQFVLNVRHPIWI